MINVKTLLADDLQEIFSPNNLLRRFTCDGGGENVAEHSVTLPFGPNKGQVRNMITGCRCEDIELGRQAVRHESEGKKRKTLHLFDQNSLINRDLRSCSFDSF